MQTTKSRATSKVRTLPGLMSGLQSWNNSPGSGRVLDACASCASERLAPSQVGGRRGTCSGTTRRRETAPPTVGTELAQQKPALPTGAVSFCWDCSSPLLRGERAGGALRGGGGSEPPFVPWHGPGLSREDKAGWWGAPLASTADCCGRARGTERSLVAWILRAIHDKSG